ncbi:hypothetical protein [Catellatospora tritici]|uniref:hypothetical protein n=1 Tax=Catellatospora tritici TaxID=2851566 RepID=UPI001C2D9D85|nr:hypothetical protein [Catellatospora tritici]MBV1856578.1 hypothetical protein [Catellatospora tritici]
MRRFPQAEPSLIVGILLGLAMVVGGVLAISPALAERRAYQQVLACQEPGGPPGCLPVERAEVTRIAETGDTMASYYAYYLDGEEEPSFTDFGRDLVHVGASIEIVRWQGEVLGIRAADGWIVTYKPGSRLLVYVYLGLIVFGAWVVLRLAVLAFVPVPLRMTRLVESAMEMLLAGATMAVLVVTTFGLATWLGWYTAALCGLIAVYRAWDNRESTRTMWRGALGRDEGPARR